MAVLIALFAAMVVTFDYVRLTASFQTDADHVWYAARALVHGRDPYPLIGPGKEFEWLWPLYYPLPAVLAIAPLGLLPLLAARIALVALPAGLLAYFLTREGYHRLPIFASGAFIASIKLVQWSPIMACILFLPWLGFFAAAKPNLGLAVLAASRSRKDFIIAAVAVTAIVLLAFAIQPTWYAEWRQLIASAPRVRPFVALPAGPLLLLSLLRWRLPEGRMFAVLSVAPLTNPSLTSTLLLLLIPRTRWDIALLSMFTFIPYFFVPEQYAYPSFERYAAVMGRVQLFTVYFPALWFLLRQPNVGPAPAFIERAIAPLPGWIRGAAAPVPAPGVRGVARMLTSSSITPPSRPSSQ